MDKPPYSFAVPSWVFPADAKENIIFLNNKVEEVELLCFEPSLPSIADFPDTNLTWHLHLPSVVPVDFFQQKEKYSDLSPLHEGNTQWGNPWILAQSLEDIDFYAYACVAIFEHCKKLAPWLAVVHLPPIHALYAQEKLVEFMEYWKQSLPLNLLAFENVRNAAHQDYKDIFCQTNYKDLYLCLDVAHAITFEQKSVLQHADIINKVRLVHWSAPYPSGKDECKNKDMHLALHHLEQESVFCQSVMNQVSKETRHLIEVFDWKEIENSIDFFNKLIQNKNSTTLN